MRRGLLLIGGLLALLLPTSARAGTEQAHAGPVSATFSYVVHHFQYSNMRLSISYAGTVRYEQPVSSPQCTASCQPLIPSRHATALRVLALQPGEVPNVVLRVYSGGAHCCEIDQVFSYEPGTRTFTEVDHNFYDAGAAIKDLGHPARPYFVSADESFYYQFTSFAASGAPVQIWSFANGRFRDVTRHHPSPIKADAAIWWRAFTHNYRDGEGVLAAWAADEDVLGHEALVARTLQRELRTGHLHSALSPPLPSGRAYIKALRRFLRKHGYVR